MNERRVIAVALVVIAATMVVNLFADTERSAEAQTVAGPVEPTVVGGAALPWIAPNGTVTSSSRLFMFWSDGRVDHYKTKALGGDDCVHLDDCGREVLLPGGAACVADIDNTGDVGFSDVLNVLADWGPCPEKP